MRRESSISAATIILKALEDFNGCSHLPTSGISDGCANFLRTIAKQVSSNIPAAFRFVCASFEENEYRAEYSTRLKELSFEISWMLLHSINTRAHYSERFEHRWTGEVRNYSTIALRAAEMRLKWAVIKTGRTNKERGKIFPLNTICRPSISFDSKSRKENGSNC